MYCSFCCNDVRTMYEKLLSYRVEFLKWPDMQMGGVWHDINILSLCAIQCKFNNNLKSLNFITTTDCKKYVDSNFIGGQSWSPTFKKIFQFYLRYNFSSNLTCNCCLRFPSKNNLCHRVSCIETSIMDVWTHVTLTNICDAQSCERLAMADVDWCTVMKSECTIRWRIGLCPVPCACADGA